MLPEFIMKRVHCELDAAKNPKGMSLHTGKVTLEICDVERMLISAAPTPPEVEPVAWLSPDRKKMFDGSSDPALARSNGYIPLYTSPPPPADDELRKAARRLYTMTSAPH
jgi:hypothetical protein